MVKYRKYDWLNVEKPRGWNILVSTDSITCHADFLHNF